MKKDESLSLLENAEVVVINGKKNENFPVESAEGVKNTGEKNNTDKNLASEKKEAGAASEEVKSKRYKKPLKFSKKLDKRYVKTIIKKQLKEEIESKIKEGYSFVEKNYLESLIEENRKLKSELEKEKNKADSKDTQIKGTMPLTSVEKKETKTQEYKLISNKTGEVIDVVSPLKLGKDPSFADYVIEDNDAVSRKHAELIIRAEKLFVKDLGSTNHTYVNGYKLPTDTEMEIKDKQQLKIADEIFLVNKK